MFATFLVMAMMYFNMPKNKTNNPELESLIKTAQVDYICENFKGMLHELESTKRYSEKLPRELIRQIKEGTHICTIRNNQNHVWQSTHNANNYLLNKHAQIENDFDTFKKHLDAMQIEKQNTLEN